MTTQTKHSLATLLIGVLFGSLSITPTAYADGSRLESRLEGEASGSPPEIAERFGIELLSNAGNYGFRLSGGIQGNVAGLLIGIEPTDLPIHDANLLVMPMRVRAAAFDARGEQTFASNVGAMLPSQVLYVQGFHSGVSDGEQVFVLSQRLRVELVEREINTDFDFDTAMDLNNLSSTVNDGDRSVGRDLGGCWTLLHYIENPDTDTQLLIAKNSVWNDLAVVFGNTQSLRDLATDLSVDLTDHRLEDGRLIEDAYHRGFYNAYQSVRSNLVNTLMAELNDVDARQGSRVFFTGHSLGGALATIASFDLTDDVLARGFSSDNVLMYSFGAPRSMSRNIFPHHKRRVTQSYAVAIDDDVITHLPFSITWLSNPYTHVQNMVALDATSMPRLTFGPDDFDYGYWDSNWRLQDEDHPHFHYAERIRSASQKGGYQKPHVSLSVNSAGNMQLHWDHSILYRKDWVGLYHGYPTDPSDFLRSGLRRYFQWADRGTSWNSGWAKGEDLFTAYVDGRYGRIVAVDDYVPTTPRVWMTKYDGWLGDFVTLNWSVSDAGRLDKVALYDRDPWEAGPDGYLFLQWKKPVNDDDNQHVTERRWRAGYYVAYIHTDEFGNKSILAVAGPTR